VEEISRFKDKKRAGGNAAAALRSHLGVLHGVRTLSGPPKTLAQLHEMHVQFHQGHRLDCMATEDAVGGHSKRCVADSNEGMPG
jgi:hypothetical protein